MDHRQTLSGHDGLDINALTPISRSYYFTELFGLDPYTVLLPKKKINDDFYRHFFKTYIFVEKYLAMAVIGIRDGKQINFEAFKSIKLPFPSLPEQQRIAQTLNTAQQEINLLKQLAEQYCTQKRGLMQKLLTGQWRVSNQ